MKSLLKWELKETFTQKSFWGIGAALLLGTLLIGLKPLTEATTAGPEAFLHILNNFNALLIFFVGIHAGLHTTKAFEERRIQTAVMAGYSRGAIILAKLFSFSLTIALYCLCTFALGASLAAAIKGLGSLGSSFFREVVLRSAVYTLVEVSFASICFLVAVLVKTLGTAIAVNLVVALGLNSLAQALVEASWAQVLLRFTAAGQTFLLIADASPENLGYAVVASLAGIALVAAAACAVLNKAELK